MIQNPFLPAPSAARAWAEGFTKGFVAISSPEPSENVSLQDIEAFGQGVVAGEESSRSGISLSDPCIPALEEHGALHIPGMLINGAEIAHGVWEARHLVNLAAGLAGIVVGLVELAITLPVHTLPPEDLLPDLGQPMVNELTRYGVDSFQLFCGAAMDATATDCEIRITPLFASLDLARQQSIAMDRMQWVVARWSPPDPSIQQPAHHLRNCRLRIALKNEGKLLKFS